MQFTKWGTFATAPVKGDGNCFYRGVLIALALEGKCFYGDDHHDKLRQATIAHAKDMDDGDVMAAEDMSGSKSAWLQEMGATGSHADLMSVRKCSEVLGIRIRVTVGKGMADSKANLTYDQQMDLMRIADREEVSHVLDFNPDASRRATIDLLLVSNHYSVIVENDAYARTCAEYYCVDTSAGANFAEELAVWKAIADAGRAEFGSQDSKLAELFSTLDISLPTDSSADAELAKLLNEEYANSAARCLSDSDYALNLQMSMLLEI